MKLRHSPFAFVLPLLLAPILNAWDYEGHRLVSRIALTSLPVEFPAFTKAPAGAERVAFLANIPDRWRNVDPWLRQSGGSWTDHFLDVEQIADAGLDPRTVPSLRYDFALAFAAGRAAHADKFAPIDPVKNADHTREWCGFAPWAIAEWFHRLRSAFAYLKVFEELGTPADVANAQADVVHAMGVLSHYVGDCAQPLHTTVHHNGWVGPNPHDYTRWPGFHSWIDGGFVAKAGVKFDELSQRVKPARPIPLAARADGRDPLFVAAMDYILEQNQLVEPLYRLEQAGKLGHGEQPITAEARAFITGQLLKGGGMLGAIWVTAWQSAPPDTYLRTALLKRQAAAAAEKTHK